MKLNLPTKDNLPKGFKYPVEYLKYIVSHNGNEVYPWSFLGHELDEINWFMDNIWKKYPERFLIPFARLDDSAVGPVACFDGNDHSGNPRIYFDVYEHNPTPDPPWEERYFIKNFSAWLEEAKEDAWDDEDRP